MLRGIRPSRPSPAIVVAVVALVAAIAGTAVAEVATTARLDKKEKKKVKKIARKQANKQIDARLPFGTDDIADGAVSGAKIANGAVNAAKVQNGALGTGEFSSSIPAAHVTRTAAQSIPSGFTTTLAFNTERYDTANMHSNATNNSRLTAPVTGIYAVTAQVEWAPDTDGIREVALEKNGTVPIARVNAVQSSEVPPVQEVTTEVRLQAGEFVRAVVGQDNSGAVALNVTKDPEYTPEFSMTWLAPGP
jgi:hypothetical protein